MIHVQMYEYLCDLNRHYQQMLNALQQLATFYPSLRQGEFKLYELRLKELQASANVQFLESLLLNEVEHCDRYQQEILELGGQGLTEENAGIRKEIGEREREG